MHHGFRIVEDMIDGMTNWMNEKGITSLDQIRGKSLPRIDNFGNFDLLNRTIARIDQQKCIHCNLCYVACEDTAHQCIDLTEENGSSKTEVREKDCVGCALCSLVCPVENCISMVRIDDGSASKTWNQLNEEFRKSGKQMTWEELAKFQNSSFN